MASTDDVFTYRSGAAVVRRMAIASGTVVYTGDMVKLSSHRIVKMASAADDINFVGVAAEAHRSTDPSGTIGVYLPLPMTIHEFALDAATDIHVGDQLQWNADQKLHASATDFIAVAIEDKLQATSCLVVFALPQATTSLPLLGAAS